MNDIRFGNDGTLRGKIVTGISKPRYEKTRSQYADASICLGCSRKKCSGTKACMARKKDENDIQRSI